VNTLTPKNRKRKRAFIVARICQTVGKKSYALRVRNLVIYFIIKMKRRINHMESLIGKKYYPIDNSYSVCLTDGKMNYQLAGNHYNRPKQPEECEIVSEPFDMVVNNIIGGFLTRQMILVKCERGFTHSVVFVEHALLKHTNDESLEMFTY
jgi:hypothetical protein